MTRLAQQYPDQFKEILEEERLSDEANGKAWSDISGRRVSPVAGASAPRRGRKVPFRHSHPTRKNKGKLGRKK